MKKQLSLLGLVLFLSQAAFAVQVTIGTGTSASTTFGPIYASSATSTFFHSKHVYIYSEAELTAAGVLAGSTINSVGWDKAGTGTNTSRFSVYMATGNPSPSGATWNDFRTGATTVYTNAALSLTAATGWQTFNLTSGFVYSGGSLIVMTEAFWSANSAALNWRYTGLTAVQTGYWNGSTAIENPSLTGSLNRPNIQLDYTAPAACTGTPTGGTIPLSLLSCGPISRLYPIGVTRAAGISFQWQQSTDGTTWVNAVGGSGATTAYYSTPSVSVATQYRAQVTCTNSGQSANSSAITIQPISKFATLPYTTSFSNNWITRCAPTPFTGESPDSFWITTPTFGNNSWRRNNTTTAVSGWTSLLGAYPNKNATDTLSARFHSYNASLGASGAMDLYINLSTISGAKGLTFEHINPTGESPQSDSLYVQLSEDGGETFRTLAVYGTSPMWELRSVTLNSNAARAVIRFLAVSDFGDDDIGIDNLTVAGACTGRPSAGIISAPNSVCPNQSFSLAATGATAGGTITYQWQSSPDGTSWTNIANATSNALSQAITNTTRYRFIIGCGASSQNDTSAAVTIAVTPTPYASLPLYESFESWLTKCAPDTLRFDVPSNSWLGSPGRGNNTWRRNDQGINGGWSSATAYMYAPAATAGSYSARFHSGSAANRSVGTLDLYINLNVTGQKQIAFDYINISGTDSLRVLISNDGGLTFRQVDTTFKLSTAWSRKAIITNSNSATAVIRFEATADFGTTDIGLDNLSISTACSGAPTAGTVATATPSVCTGATVNLTGSGNSIGFGLTQQWQSSTNGGMTWTNIAGATGTNLTTTVFSTSQFRMVTTCANGMTSANTAAQTITVSAPSLATVPYVQNFSTWATRCASGTATNDSPAPEWIINPSMGENSWRRSNEGATAGWGNVLGAYVNRISNDTLSARFHTYGAPNRTVGTMDLHVNLSGIMGVKDLSFYHINVNGTDSLRVLLSTDNGTSFSQIGATLRSPIAAWSRRSFPINSNATSAIIRLEATSDFGLSDMGVDSLTILKGCAPATIAAASSLTFCAGDSVRLAARGIGTIRWSTGATDSVIFAKATGTYAVTMTDGACSVVDSIRVTVNPKPTPSFTTVVAGGSVTFTNTSTLGSSYRWTFGDAANSTSTAQNPTFVYTANGNYTVKLVVTSAAGCRDSISRTINVTRVGTTELMDKLSVKVFPNPVQTVLTVQFIDQNAVLKPTDRLIITNLLGQVVADMPITAKQMDIQTHQWATGTYYLTARLNGVSMPIEQIIKIE
jgi:hypothetical protein